MVKLIPYKEHEPLGFWRSIPGYPNYEASVEGQIRRRYKGGYTLLKPYRRNNRIHTSIFYFKISKDGKTKEVSYHRKVWEAFHGEIPAGKKIIHKNGICSDHAIHNLEMVDNATIGKIFARRAASKSVLKYDPETMECVDAYPSARVCAKENGMSYQTIMDRCNNTPIFSPAPDGYEYCWEDDNQNASYRNMVARIRRGPRKGNPLSKKKKRGRPKK